MAEHNTLRQAHIVQADHPDFLQFLKAYYEFMEAAELKLNALASQDAILYEEGSTTYITQENVNRYRESNDTILLEDYDAVGSEAARINGAFINGETIVGSTSKATATVRVEDITDNSGTAVYRPQYSFFGAGATMADYDQDG